jgi:hypothetical protein
MACVPTLGTPFPTADPSLINTFIAQTANAAASQTAAALPTSTFTETPTPTPENTSTPSPTFTSTVIFILSSPTKPVVPTFTGLSSGGGSSSGGGGGSTSSDNYACQVISVDPANGTSFNPSADFDATWRVKNIGQKDWDRTSIDVVYDSGAKIHKIAGYDLNTNVKVGENINITVDMVAPKDSGSYTTNWVLQASAKVFCKMTLTINVK